MMRVDQKDVPEEVMSRSPEPAVRNAIRLETAGPMSIAPMLRVKMYGER